MGLDSVELVVAFEERFDLAIPNADCERLRTVRDVIDYVHPRVAERAWSACPTRTAFYRLRRALPPRWRRVRPATPLSLLFADGSRVASWRRLATEVGMPAWPELEPPPGTVLVLLSITLLGTVVGGAIAGIPAGLVAAVNLSVLSVLANRLLSTRLPRALATVGDLARRTALWNLPPAGGGWTRGAVREVVRALVREQLGLDDSFSDDDRFVDDLGLC